MLQAAQATSEPLWNGLHRNGLHRACVAPSGAVKRAQPVPWQDRASSIAFRCRCHVAVTFVKLVAARFAPRFRAVVLSDKGAHPFEDRRMQCNGVDPIAAIE